MKDTKSKSILSDLRALIDGHPRETELQSFLEANPLLFRALFYRYPERDLVVSKFPLGVDFRTDFAFLTYGDTEGLWLHLVEIERPDLLLFTSADEFTAEANRAFQQLHDWASWCSSHRETLIHMVAPLTDEKVPFFFFNVSCVLIAGRRSQVSNPRRRERLTTRANLKREAMRFQTWDGFLELAESNITWYQWEPDANGRMHHIWAKEGDEGMRCVSYREQGLFEKYISGNTPETT